MIGSLKTNLETHRADGSITIIIVRYHIDIHQNCIIQKNHILQNCILQNCIHLKETKTCYANLRCANLRYSRNYYC